MAMEIVKGRESRPRLLDTEIRFIQYLLVDKWRILQMKYESLREARREINRKKDIGNLSNWEILHTDFDGLSRTHVELAQKEYQVYVLMKICEGMMSRFERILNGVEKGRIPFKAMTARAHLASYYPRTEVDEE